MAGPAQPHLAQPCLPIRRGLRGQRVERGIGVVRQRGQIERWRFWQRTVGIGGGGTQREGGHDGRAGAGRQRNAIAQGRCGKALVVLRLLRVGQRAGGDCSSDFRCAFRTERRGARRRDRGE
ncbi:hypothetical protein G6F22_019044 [Rhizopus arrhizus]|nr:hypothetical protein G6F22_019044 [Rhizopus arrhizus]